MKMAGMLTMRRRRMSENKAIQRKYLEENEPNE